MTLVDPVPVPMERAVGPVIGALLADVHRRHGVRTRFGVGVQAVSGQAGDLTVALTDGSELRAETVTVGIGARPNDNWLHNSGLLIDDGVVCDEYLAAVGTEHVFAVGDDANLPLARMLARNNGVLESVRSTEPIDFKLKAFLSNSGSDGPCLMPEW